MILDPISALTKLLPKPRVEIQGKMKWSDIVAIYPPPSQREKPDRNGHVTRYHATQKNHRHTHNPVWLPGKPNISPAEYRRRHLGRQ